MNYLLPIISHLLGDFVLQNSKMAVYKNSNINHFILHCFIYSACILLSFVWFQPLNHIIYCVIIISLSHGIIDFFRGNITNKLVNKQKYSSLNDFTLFLIDQMLHIFIIIFTINIFKINNGTFINNIPYKNIYNFSLIALLYIICLSPGAVFIKKIFILFSFQENNIDDLNNSIIKSGYLIGILERIIILTLWLNGQLSSIGFILAAKSLARFNQLNNKDFAEKYLVGTLMSVTIALLCISAGNAFLL